MNSAFEGHVLLVGEGDFSFSVALVKFIPFVARKLLISTSYETEDSILKHKTALGHIDILKKQGVTVYLETDATQIHSDPRLMGIHFDRIIFNFPHSGGKSNHKKNRNLLSDFFCSAVQILKGNGQILMTLCKGQGGTPADRPLRAWHDSWQVVSMAANAGLILKEVWPFVASNFPEYTCTGFRSQDKGFNTEGAITHVFQKANKVDVPMGGNSLSQYRLDYLCSRINRKFVEEETHPIAQLHRKLLDTFTSCFEVHQYQCPSPQVDNYNLEGISKMFISDDKGDHSNYFKSFQSKLYQKCETENLEISSIKEVIQNNLISVSVSEFRGNIDFDSQNSNHIENLGFKDTKETREVIPNAHLWFSMIEHVNYLLDCMKQCDSKQNTLEGTIDSNDTVNINCNKTEHPGWTLCTKYNRKQNGGKTSDSMLPIIHIMTDEVCQPCGINFCRCPVKTEMLGILQCEETTYDQEKTVSYCQGLCSCLNDLFPELKVRLDLKDMINFDDSPLSEFGVMKLDTPKIAPETNVGYIFLQRRKDIKRNSLIFIINLNILTIEAFNIPHVEILFSETNNFSTDFLRLNSCFKYRPTSLFPVLFEHDMSFWENGTKQFDEYMFSDVIRGVAKETVVSVKLIDSYVCETTGRKSRCYRLQFQSHDKALSYDISWKMQSIIRLEVARILEITLR